MSSRVTSPDYSSARLRGTNPAVDSNTFRVRTSILVLPLDHLAGPIHRVSLVPLLRLAFFGLCLSLYYLCSTSIYTLWSPLLFRSCNLWVDFCARSLGVLFLPTLAHTLIGLISIYSYRSQCEFTGRIFEVVISDFYAPNTCRGEYASQYVLL